MTAKGIRGAVIIGGYVNALGLVRSLAARGIPVAVVTTQPYDIAHLSRHVCGHASLPDGVADGEALLHLLQSRAPEWSGWAVYPTHDEALEALARYHEPLSASYHLVMPAPDAVPYLLDKRQMLDLAGRVGLDLPSSYGPAQPGMPPPPHFPVVVKPCLGHQFAARFGAKLFVARDAEDLERCTRRSAEAGIPCEVFDLVPGGDDQIFVYCTYVDGDGEPSAGITVHKIRQSPPFFGVARVAEVVKENPVLREAAVELLRALGFRGMAAVEFKLDPRDGSFRFMEVNGRSVLYNALLRKAGLDMAALAWADYVEGAPRPAEPRLWPGVWLNLHADLLYSVLYRRHDPLPLREFLRPYGRPKLEAVWSAKDPRPFLAQWSRTAGEALSALRHGSVPKLLADGTAATPAP